MLCPSIIGPDASLRCCYVFVQIMCSMAIYLHTYFTDLSLFAVYKDKNDNHVITLTLEAKSLNLNGVKILDFLFLSIYDFVIVRHYLVSIFYCS